MFWLVFVIALSSDPVVQTTGLLDATPETYQAPVVRPFEPPSDFGREQAQGDADMDLHRAPLTRPVDVGAYVGSYEVSPTDAEVAYDQGVAQAEIDTDRLMGPLDGRWRVSAADGAPLMSLALTDRGQGRRVEGAWRRLDAPPETPLSGPAGPVATVGGKLVVPVSGGELRLQPAGPGWTGEWVQDGRARPVTVSRIG
jgi:hypothetical protein